MEKVVLKLYVAGQSPRSEFAIENLSRICEKLSGHEITIVDVLDHPQMAENNEILVTPTLVKEFPLPVQRIIGDLSDEEGVLSGLNIQCCNRHVYNTDRTGNQAMGVESRK